MFKALRGVPLATCVALGLLMVLASGALAASPIYECVPAKYGAALTAGNASGECKANKKTTYTPVALPATAEEQQKLLAILPYIKYVQKGVGGKPTIQFSGANVQIVNGEGKTETANGAGNLIIGYDQTGGEFELAGEPITTEAVQTGSHNLVLGALNTYTSWGSILGGPRNTASGPLTQVFGWTNTASNGFASVTGGVGNYASGPESPVSGGELNEASGVRPSVSGEIPKTASLWGEWLP